LAGCGNNGDALAFGGATGATVAVSTTDKWAATAWATTIALNQSKFGLAGCGTTSDALSFGGATGATVPISTVERWAGIA